MIDNMRCVLLDRMILYIACLNYCVASTKHIVYVMIVSHSPLDPAFEFYREWMYMQEGCNGPPTLSAFSANTAEWGIVSCR